MRKHNSTNDGKNALCCILEKLPSRLKFLVFVVIMHNSSICAYRLPEIQRFILQDAGVCTVVHILFFFSQCKGEGTKNGVAIPMHLT